MPTGEMRERPPYEAADLEHLGENIAEAEAIMTSVVIPTLKDIQAELEKNDVHAEVTHTPSTSAHSLGSIEVFGGVVPREGEPRFYYDVSIRATPEGVECSSNARVAYRGQSQGKTLGPGLYDIKARDLTGEAIKADFAAKYEEASRIVIVEG
ncbi:MAG: hypothetical protein ACXV76_10840 [Halobacteriota archaeon]